MTESEVLAHIQGGEGRRFNGTEPQIANSREGRYVRLTLRLL